MRLRIIYEAAILVLFLLSALVIMFVVNKAVPLTLEGDTSAAEYVQRGNRLYAMGRAKYNEAAIQYWEAAKRNPHIAEAHLRLAEIYYEYTVWDYQVLYELGEVERTDPNNPGLYLLMGKVHNRMGDSDKALEAFHRAVILQPGNSEAHYYLGTVYEQQAMKEEAIGEYEKAIQAFAESLSERGNVGESAHVKVGSDSVMALNSHLQLGRIYKDREPEKAESEFKAAFGIDPASAEVISELRALYREEAEGYEDRNDYDKAAEKYEEMVKIDPDNPRNVEIYMKLGNIYRNNELFDKACAMYEAAAKLDPLNFDAFSALKELELLKKMDSE